MLSAIMDVAPFADFAVARIANDTKDLINQKERTSQNLARVRQVSSQYIPYRLQLCLTLH